MDITATTRPDGACPRDEGERRRAEFAGIRALTGFLRLGARTRAWYGGEGMLPRVCSLALTLSLAGCPPPSSDPSIFQPKGTSSGSAWKQQRLWTSATADKCYTLRRLYCFEDAPGEG